MATIDKLVGLVTRNFPRARIWLSEYGYQSNPPDRLLGISLALQARYLAEGEYVGVPHAARRSPDPLPVPRRARARPLPERARDIGRQTETGARRVEAARETSRAGARVSLWGRLGAPGAPSWTARIERRVGAVWRPLGSIRPGAGG